MEQGDTDGNRGSQVRSGKDLEEWATCMNSRDQEKPKEWS